jgi:SpoVK/Ycf46/Vps4 family AAA+-type ATPase
MLTQLDKLKCFPNILTFATSNLIEALDTAFVDRADFCLYLGPPSLHSRYQVVDRIFSNSIDHGFLH